MSILKKIVEKKKERLAFAKSLTPLTELKSIINDLEKTRDFKKAIKRISDNIKLIAEIKKASPLKGIIRKDFNHLSIATTYEKKKVNAVSVLTEEDFFMGSLTFLSDVKKFLTKPVLRKDFLFDEYQIYESRANGADAILLISTILDKNQAAEYIHLAKEIGLSVLFEVHDLKELETALLINADIIGINNRNLKTMHIDQSTTLKLKKEIPPDRIVVTESGIQTREDVLKFENEGIDAMLIGTSLMQADNIGEKIDELMG
ncbi:MAG: indole-3-glycerol phosphate synthase TrpC [Nitrospirae bacterium]|nr:indole-3-glycerol phosphate synthase TrpC [Nitrospirota bacterium]